MVEVEDLENLLVPERRSVDSWRRTGRQERKVKVGNRRRVGRSARKGRTGDEVDCDDEQNTFDWSRELGEVEGSCLKTRTGKNQRATTRKTEENEGDDEPVWNSSQVVLKNEGKQLQSREFTLEDKSSKTYR